MVLVNLIPVFVGSLLLNGGGSEALELDFDPDTPIHIEENVPAGTELFRVDASGTGKVMYKIDFQSPDDIYQIDETTGIITVADGQTPDSDSIFRPIIMLEIGDAKRTIFVRLTNVTVDDLNDNAPFWSTAPIGTIGALTEEGTLVKGSFNASDMDRWSPNTFVVNYTLESESYFHIDPITALVTVREGMTGPDTGCYYSHLYASDKGDNPGPLTGTTTVTIRVISASCLRKKVNMCS